MGGPIVRTGTTPEFWRNWDQAFGDKKKTKKKSSPKAGKKSIKKKGAKKSKNSKSRKQK